MGDTEKAPTADVKETVAQKDRVPAGEARPRVTTWSRRGAAAKTPGAPRNPATADAPTVAVAVADKPEAPDAIGAPFVETIASSFAEPRKGPDPAKPDDIAAAESPVKASPVEVSPVEAPMVEASTVEAPTVEAPAVEASPVDMQPDEGSASAQEQPVERRKPFLPRDFKPGRLLSAIRLPKQLPQAQNLARLPARVIEIFRERPIRRELKIGLAAVVICGAGLTLGQMVLGRPAPVSENAPAETVERSSAAIESQDAHSPSPKTPESVLDSAPSQAEPTSAPVADENSSGPNDSRDLRAGGQDGAGAQDSKGAQVGLQANAQEQPAEARPDLGASEPPPVPDVVASAKVPDAPNIGAPDAADAAPAPARSAAEPTGQDEKDEKDEKQAAADNLDAEARLRAALAHGKTTHDKRLIAVASDKLGAILYERGEVDDAEAAFRRGLRLYEELTPSDADAVLKEGIARTCNGLGRIHRDRGHFDKAEKMYNKAADIDKKLGRNAELANDYNNLGLVYLAWKKLDLAEQVYLKALDIQKAQKSNEGIAGAYSNLGQIYFTRGDLKKAVDMFRKAIAVENTGRRKETVAMDYSNLGVVYAKRRDFVNACACWRKARRMLQDAGKKLELERVLRALRSESCSQHSEAASLEPQ